MHHSHRPKLAVVVIIATVFALALGDTLIKGAVSTFSLWQILVLRSVMVLVVLIFLVHFKAPGATVIPLKPLWTILRSVLLTIMWLVYYLSLAHVDISVAASTLYTLPIFITLFAAFVLNESITLPGWCAVMLGFIGVLLILNPNATDFNGYAVLPLISAVLYAAAMMLTRTRCRRENILVLSLWLNLVMLISGVLMSLILPTLSFPQNLADSQAFFLGSWQPLDLSSLGQLIVLSAAIMIGSIGAAYAYQNGHPATIATFEFAYIGFAIIFAIFIFDEQLSLLKLTGMVLVVGAGILAIHAGKHVNE